MTVRMRHTRGHTGNRRSHHALTEPRTSKCPECGAMHLRHRACEKCGKYRGRVVSGMVSKIEARKGRIHARTKGASSKASNTEEKAEESKASKKSK